jgi:hypothetical protein
MPFEEYDIIINGGSFGAVAAALQSARDDKDIRILLIEPTDWLGGQATTQGVSAIDYAWQEPARSLFKNNPEDYLPKDYLEFINILKNRLIDFPGSGYGGEECCWVSRDCFDPRSAAFVLEKMIEQYPNITLKKFSIVKRVITEEHKDEFGKGSIITSLKIITRKPINDYKPFDKFLSDEISDWYSEKDSNIFSKEVTDIIPRDKNNGFIIIDGSEFGDVIVLSKSDYTIGREIDKEGMEDGVLPTFDEDAQQSFVFCFCTEMVKEPAEEGNLKKSFNEFDAYFFNQIKNYFSFGKHSWGKIWTYRRLKRAGDDKAWDGIYKNGDVSMQNWYPGNDYPYGSLFKNRPGAAEETPDWKGGIRINELANAEKHAVAWYFYFKENKPAEINIKFLKENDPCNMMGTGTGLAKMPYFRDTRRIIGLNNFRILEKDYNQNNYTSKRYFDSVGIGQYAADIHPIIGYERGLSPIIESPLPFYIPYRSLASNNIRNLLAAGKNFSCSYITNSAYRLHPIEWSAGCAAGAAAVLMYKKKISNYKILEETNLDNLKENISRNSPLKWKAYDN